MLVDPTTCVLTSPRQLAEIAHPTAERAAFTHIALSADAWHELNIDEHVPLVSRISASMQVSVRAMVAAGRGVEHQMAIEEEALKLVAAVVAHAEPVRVASGRPVSDCDRRQLAEAARTILISDPALSSVARGCGPSRLLPNT